MSDTNDATSDWDRVREEGERVSRDEAYQVLSAEIAALATKNDRLREACRRLVEQDATLSACDDSVTVTVNAGLTTAEREAVEWAAYAAAQWYEHTASDALRGLLERMK